MSRSRNTPTDSVSGVIPIDKPVGPTSHDIVDEVRRAYGVRRVGHTGTLDPAASGLLIVLLGRATKVATFLTGLDKTYLATVRFGQTSDTGDADGVLTDSGDPSSLTESTLAEIVAALTALTTQDVPAYAAVRSNGRRRYELARSGEDVPAMERTITIHTTELVAYSGGTGIIRLRCSSGTYVRSIAEHVGREAGCGAHLAALRREQIGEWHVRDAFELETVHAHPKDKAPVLVKPVEDFLPFTRVFLNDDAIVGVGHGKPIRPRHVRGVTGTFRAGDLIALCNSTGQVVAIADACVGSTNLESSAPSIDVCHYRRVLIG